MQCNNCGQELRPGTRFCTKCGTLVTSGATAPTPPPRPTVSFGNAPGANYTGAGVPQAPRKSGGCGKVLLVLALLGVVGIVGVGIGGYYLYRFAQNKIKSSEAYTVALKALKENPEVA